MPKFAQFTEKVEDLILSGLQDVTDKEIHAALEPMLRGQQLLGVDTFLVGKPGAVRTFKTRTSVNASVFNEGEDIYLISPEITRNKIQCTPSNFGASDVITGDTLDAEDFDEINDVKQAIIDAMARFIDSRVWNRLLNTFTETDDDLTVLDTPNGVLKWFRMTPGGNVALTPGTYGILDMVDVKVNTVAKTEGTEYSVDYYNGKVYFETAPTGGQTVTCTYYWAKTRNVVNAKTIGQASYEDLVDASGTVSGNKGVADVAVMHTNESSDLMKTQLVYDVSQYGSTEPRLKGEVGTLAGLKILPTTEMYEGVMVILQKGPKMGRYVYKRKLSTKVEKLQKRADDIFLGSWERSDACVLRSTLICLVVNAQRYAKAYSA